MPKTMWIVLAVTLLLSPLFFTAGCVVRTHGDPLITVEVESEPPAPRYEAPSPTPGPQHAWVPGRWDWNGRNWNWVPGHWQRVSRGYHTWEPGHWERRGHRWVWIEGYWR